MLKSDIIKWTNALRSGEYRQGKYKLQDKNSYCCLGVACKVLAPEYMTFNGYLVGTYPESRFGASRALEQVSYKFMRDTGANLMTLNDAEGFTFNEIADLLESIYVHEVLK